MHSINYPELLTECTPSFEHTNYLHIITTVPNFESTPATEVYNTLFASDSSFGLLTAKQLPPLAEFTLQQPYGSITIKIESNPVRIDFDDTHKPKVLRLIKFHNLIFDEIVATNQPFLANDWSNLENSFLVVPTTKQRTIDWATVDEFQVLRPCPDDHSKRPKLQLNADDYLHRIVYPWYRVDNDMRYLVLKVHEHLTPFSAFPSHQYESYAAYIQDKYDVQVMNKDQFMLEVKSIHPNLNALVRQDAKAFANRGPEMLIPEFCHNLGFSGGLWLKAMLLPSVLHRVHFLLNAEANRVALNNGE